MKIGVIGYGYWGPNLLRNFAEIGAVDLKWCADTRADRRALVKKRYPTIRVAENAEQILDDPEVNAVVIATPVSAHYHLAKQALERGKHVLVEKPMTRTVAEGQALLELADKKNLILMVDHTFIYTGAVRKMKEILDVGELGDLYYLDSVRVNLGLFQSDIDVLWDLAPHDLAILTYLIHEAPKFVSATGADHTESGLADVAYMTMHFANNFIAHFHVNWLSPVKVRTTLIGGKDKMLVWNDLEPDEKIRIYDKGVDVTSGEGVHEMLVSYRTGDVWAPKVDQTEALKLELGYFIDCIMKDQAPSNDGAAGLRVVRLLEAAEQSLNDRGKAVLL